MPPSPAGSWQLDASDAGALERYLLERGLIAPADTPIAAAVAGAGNMNVTIRVTPSRGRSVIVKQGRPWVAKYPQIQAPVERTSVEAAFYREVSAVPGVARLMPALRYVDADNHVIVLEDVGAGGDWTPLYGGASLPMDTLDALLAWLSDLAAVQPGADTRGTFANRAMRALNAEHMFHFPLRPDNGLDLDAITPGLREAAGELQGDTAYCDRAGALGRRYLGDGGTLTHGDFFPGSWLRAGDGVRVIDPEFCFLGDPEFDSGILAAHLLIAGAGGAALGRVGAAIADRRLDAGLVSGFAGVEIMRRLIGVAQLPLTLDIGGKRRLLELSRRLVLHAQKVFA